jgi:hypothetical protein
VVRTDSNVGNPKEFLLVAHPEIPEERGESEQDELDGNTVIIPIDNGGVRVYVGLPAPGL